MYEVVLRQARFGNEGLVDIGVTGETIAAIAPRLGPACLDIDAQGKTMLPGLVDHHIHLLATAARMSSVDLADCLSIEEIIGRLRSAPGAGWVRAIGYDERVAGLPGAALLDRWIADRPLRLQDRTGALWALNSAALAQLGPSPWPDCVEIDRHGQPTGRLWRGDAWLRTRLTDTPPSLAALSAQLLRHGVTAVTDAGAQNGPAEAQILGDAVGAGTLPQRLTLMGLETLAPSPLYQRGPVKLLYDERDLPSVEMVAQRIQSAHQAERSVAAHCVTLAELVLYLGALDVAGGARAGDRIEHGSIIAESLIADIASAGLIVVANPGLLAARGDRYQAEIEADALPDLHRLQSLCAANIPLLGGSDAPYGPVNPWIAIRAAQDRRAPSGATINPSEALDADQAGALFAGPALSIGGRADLCLAEGDCDPVDPICLTMIGGKILFSR